MTHAKHPGFTCLLLLGISLVIAGTQSVAGTTDKIYKWVDQNGDTQYTQMPPPTGAQVLEIRNAPPPADDSAAERTRLQQQTKALDERMKERQESAAKAEERAKNEEIRRQNCTRASKNLAELQQGGTKRYRMPNGEVMHLTEEDRQKRITETKAQIAEFCKD
jgi:hypothetical protein